MLQHNNPLSSPSPSDSGASGSRFSRGLRQRLSDPPLRGVARAPWNEIRWAMRCDRSFQGAAACPPSPFWRTFWAVEWLFCDRSPSGFRMQSDQPCKHCSKTVPPESALSLWDGESYCRACVESVLPELADYAGSHGALEETAPFDRRAHWRDAFRMEALCVLFFGVLFVTAGYSLSGPAGIVSGIGLLIVICSAQAAIQLPMFVWMGRWMRPTVVVKDGRIECYRGGRRTWYYRSLPLEDAKWRIGKSRQDSGLRSTFVRRQDVVLVVLPRAAGRLSFGSDRYACGWSDRMRRIWIAFLTLAEVPKAE